MRVYEVKINDLTRFTTLMDFGEKGYYWETKTEFIVEFPKKSVILQARINKSRFRNDMELFNFRTMTLSSFTRVEGVVEQ